MPKFREKYLPFTTGEPGTISPNYTTYYSPSTLYSATYTPSQSYVYAKLPTFTVKVNNTIIDNLNAKYPLLIYKNITYFPMTFNYANALGLTTQWDSKSFGVLKNASASNYTLSQDLTGNNSVTSSCKAVLPTFNIFVNNKWVNNSTEEYPVFVFRDITYFPMTWKFAVTEFGLNTSWNSMTGFSIVKVEHQDTSVNQTVQNVISIYYDDNYGVPDFGKITNCSLVSGDGTYYRYNSNEATESEVEQYKASLIKNGFTYATTSSGDIYNNYSLGNLGVYVTLNYYSPYFQVNVNKYTPAY